MRPRLAPSEACHLDRASELAERGRGQVHPNPMVGCVLVRDGEVVSEGWHQVYGGPHAEVVALERAGEGARGATAYISMEPCNHQGKTPPCTRALLDAGIRRVVFGAADPGDASGGGAHALREAGIDVLGPVYTPRRARTDNPGFFHDDPSRPWTLLKMAISLDGAVSRSPDAPTPLTGEEVRRQVHRLRAGSDAVLVGAGTVRADDPRLTVREGTPPRIPPRRVILDPGHTWPPEGADGAPPASGSLLDPVTAPVDVVVREEWVEARRERLEPLGLNVLSVTTTREGRLDPVALMEALAAEGVVTLLCEGGPRLARCLLAEGLVDRLALATAPCMLGPGSHLLGPLPDHDEWTPLGEPRRLGRDLWCEWERGD